MRWPELVRKCNVSAPVGKGARGWPVFTAIKDAKGASEQMAAYHTALAVSGHDQETIRLAKEWSSVGKAVHVADTDAQARSEAEDFFLRNPSGAIARNPDDMVCGSPETVSRIMNDFAATGVGVMICGFLIDVENPERVRRSVRLFEEKVIPNVVGANGVVGRRAMAN